MTDSANTVDADPAVYKTLLESTKAIPWKIDWATKTFAYIGPQIEALLGWSPSTWAGVQDWVDRMHEEDRQRVFDFCVSQSIAGVDHEADYRALTKDGGFVWIRDVVHVVRTASGDVDSLVGFMFDISERKETEQALVRLQKELEELSFRDGLTGIANRRMFDSILDIEWTNARRNSQPLSMLMIDIDHFKQFNDRYGHLAGDDCLKQVAGRLAKAATRPRDLVARFGGEEFVLVLPESDSDAAARVAERCRDHIFKAQLVHESSPTSRMVTISIGVGTILPGHGDDPMAFVDAVDRSLYRAKQEGRNRIVANR